MKLSRGIFVCFFVMLCSGAFAERVRVVGTSVSLEPPPGFTQAKQFPGFAKEEITASIMVTEVPGPYSKVTEGMTNEGLASRGMTLIDREDDTNSKPPRILLHVAQDARGLEFLKWMLITGDEKKTVMVVGTYPKSKQDEVGEAIKNAVLTTRIDATAPQNPWEGLLFRVTPTPKLKFAAKFSNAAVFTRNGVMRKTSPTDPVYLVAPLIGGGRVGNLKTFGEVRLKKTESARNIKNVRGKPTQVGSMRGYEILADASDTKTGTPIRIYQVVIEGVEQDYLIQGLVGAKIEKTYLPEFRRLTSTFRVANPNP
jgi:hypothetical protein